MARWVQRGTANFIVGVYHGRPKTGLTLHDFTYDLIRCAIKADNVKNRSIEYPIMKTFHTVRSLA